MKKLLLFFLFCAGSLLLFAQEAGKKDVFVFNITNYIIALNDSTTLVQVHLPNTNSLIAADQVGVLRHNYTNIKEDTAMTGWGKCQLIKGDYYYFGIHLNEKKNKPVVKDLIYTRINYPANYKGFIYKMIQNAVYFDHVTDEPFYDFNTAMQLDEQKENSLIDSLLADIRYTGKAMLEQSNGQDHNITGGIFDGKKLFVAMQTVTASQVKKFLGYVVARPQKYAGNHWKISETFATWMTSATPMRVE